MQLEIHPPLPRRKDWRIGVVGAGFIVTECHLVSYRKLGLNPYAIASRTKDRAEIAAGRHGIPKVHALISELLADESIEVLDLAVPPDVQLGIIEEACRRGIVKGILAQKPLGVHASEAARAVALCEKAGIVLAVNQNMRYDPSVRAAKHLLDSGYLGEPVFCSLDMRGIPHWMPWQERLGWVTLRIMSIHHIDAFRFWFGDPARIYCSLRSDPRTRFPHQDGICSYILEYENGMRCVSIDDTWTGPAKEGCPADIGIRYRIEGTEGLALGDIGWCKEPFTSPSSLRYARIGDTEFNRPEWKESWFPDAFGGCMSQLLIAIETGEPPALSGRDNLNTMALVDAGYLSAKEHRAVSPREILDSLAD